jgi:hypothetical protein
MYTRKIAGKGGSDMKMSDEASQLRIVIPIPTYREESTIAFKVGFLPKSDSLIR